MKKSFAQRTDNFSDSQIDAHVFSRVSHRVEIKAIPIYLDEESFPEENKFVWAYHIQIFNNRVKAVKLIKRVWDITDGRGVVHQVRGEGVIGEQPVIDADTMFEYTSAVPLSTPTGFMSGHYEMVDEDGREFSVKVPAFSLDSPHIPHTLQ